MYKVRRLSDLELDAIDIYSHIETKSVEHIAKDLKCPVFYINNIIFKYLNGCVKNGYLYSKKLDSRNVKLPRKFITLTPQAALQSYKELMESGLKLRTVIIKED